VFLKNQIERDGDKHNFILWTTMFYQQIKGEQSNFLRCITLHKKNWENVQEGKCSVLEYMNAHTIDRQFGLYLWPIE